jgi:hypothetical protein
MLFDPKWHKPASIYSLIAWLERQPADKPYEWTSEGNCGAAQYLIAHGQDPKDMILIPDWVEIFQGLPPFDHTFGAALERARTISNWRNAAC